jgi:hypothetical protein
MHERKTHATLLISSSPRSATLTCVVRSQQQTARSVPPPMTVAPHMSMHLHTRTVEQRAFNTLLLPAVQVAVATKARVTVAEH